MTTPTRKGRCEIIAANPAGVANPVGYLLTMWQRRDEAKPGYSYTSPEAVRNTKLRAIVREHITREQ